MLLKSIPDSVSPTAFLTICFIALLAHLLYNRYRTGLNHIPGPALASLTDFYRLWIVWQRRPEQWHIRLHEEYGDLVRIGPRTVISSSNRAAKQIYALNAGFIKVLLCYRLELTDC